MSPAFFEMSSDYMAVGPEGSTRWTSVNPALAARLGYDTQDAALAGLEEGSDPARLATRDGSWLIVDWNVQVHDGLAYWVGRERKSNLMRELHHRVKNNLQFFISLLAFQAARVGQIETRAQLSIAEGRIRTLARLHESAYSSPDFSEVEFGRYLRELVRLTAAEETCALSVDAVDAVMPIGQAAPLAMIAHELISNAIEYASASQVQVSLSYDGEDRVCLRVKDDGRGMGAAKAGGGLELVDLFVEQLQGRLHAGSAAGVDLSVSFQIRDK